MHQALGKQGRSNDIWLMSCQSLNIKCSFPIVNLYWIRAFEKITRVWRNFMYQGNAWDSLKLVLSSYTLVLFWWQLHASALIMVLFSNVRTWHLKKPAWKVVLPRLLDRLNQETLQDFLKVACKDSSKIAVVLWPKLGSGWLLACA